MTVHNPSNTSLGTRRSVESFLEGFKALRNILKVHSPPSTSLGKKRSDESVRSITHDALERSRCFWKPFEASLLRGYA
jgi:hypothetical protein